MIEIVLKKILLPIVILLFGICIGICIRDFPLFTISYHLKITDILGVVVSLGIGIFIPLVVKKLIEDNKAFREILIEEFSSLNSIIDKIKDKAEEISNSKSITQTDKESLLQLFENSDFEFSSLVSFINIHCQKETQSELTKLKTLFFEYWNILTSSSVMDSSIVKLDNFTLKQSMEKHSAIKNSIREIKTSLLSI